MARVTTTTDRSGATATAPPGGGSAGPARALHDRLRTPMSVDGIWGWLVPAAIALVAGILRFDRLAIPSSYVFDEVYYADDAADLLAYGVEYDPESGGPQFVVHPPVGKWVIALGQLAFGDDSLGWRVPVAVLGTLAVFLLGRIARRLFRSVTLGAVAATLLAVDGMAFVLSRTAILDGILMFWLLCAFGALLVDRDHARDRLAVRMAAGRSGGLRPWRLAAGVFLGLAVATKWNGAWFVVAFGLMTVLWDVDARRCAGARHPRSAMLRRDAVPAFCSVALLAVAVYVASWTGWFLGGDRAYDRFSTAGPGWLPQPLQGLWAYHEAMLGFHRNLSTWHAYESHPWSWLVMGRPVSFAYRGLERGELGCEADACSRAVLAIGTPMLWWGGVVALLVVVLLWLGRRDWRAGAVLGGFGAGWLPWFLFADRTQYAFYAVVMLPFMILAVTMCLGLLLGPPTASPVRRAWGAGVAGAIVLVVVLNFAYFFPIYTDATIPYEQWRARMWLTSWI